MRALISTVPGTAAVAACGLLPVLRVVMLHGGSARDGWARLARRHPAEAARFEVVPTYEVTV